LRLFACAAVRSVWDRLQDERCRQAVCISERFADGLATLEELNAAQVAAMAARDDAELAVLDPPVESSVAAYAASSAALAVTYYPGEEGAWLNVGEATGWAASARFPGEFDATEPEELTQCRFLRCVFGNPFRPVRLDPSLLTGNNGLIPRLAQAAYD